MAGYELPGWVQEASKLYEEYLGGQTPAEIKEKSLGEAMYGRSQEWMAAIDKYTGMGYSEEQARAFADQEYPQGIGTIPPRE